MSRSRVTPGRSCTIAICFPASRLKRADLPTLGRPTMATILRVCVSMACGGDLSDGINEINGAGTDDEDGSEHGRFGHEGTGVGQHGRAYGHNLGKGGSLARPVRSDLHFPGDELDHECAGNGEDFT